MKIFHIVGARPQFVKAAMVSRSLSGKAQGFLLHTGQHYDENMSKLFFEELGLKKPDINLGIGGGSHAEQTAAMISGVDHHLAGMNPDIVVVYGDTNSTLAGAIAASKRNIKLAHVEAGLRSFNRTMPEEINRVISDHVSNLLFCPTTLSVQNLSAEGIFDGVHLVGDVMADALFQFILESDQKSNILDSLNIKSGSYALATVHRSGNVDSRVRLASIVQGFAGIEIPIIFPVHPRTRKMLAEFSLTLPDNIIDIEPVGYLDMLQLEKNAECIMTDSGGIQKEAYLLGVRCITLREETEWMEIVENGWNILVGWDSKEIPRKFNDFKPPRKHPDLYGDGHAADKISDVLISLV
jgi:UDP-N-acetylglucosamine 2-epimerase